MTDVQRVAAIVCIWVLAIAFLGWWGVPAGLLATILLEQGP
ncbi:MAG: hypothetical protein ACREDH_15625 [Methylocella sp.]